jgi:DNA-binding PadR family transcriptional regulator
MLQFMKHRHHDGSDRHSARPEDHSGHHHSHHGRHRGHRRHGGRLFDYGDLRLLILAMIADRPRHGYELIKAIEERFGGSYSPSPGVIYPTLSWLNDMGYAASETEDAGRKSYRITSEGEAFLVANRAAADELLSRAAAKDNADPVPASVMLAMENLKLSMRSRLKRGPLDQTAAESIAAALDTAAQTVERS